MTALTSMLMRAKGGKERERVAEPGPTVVKGWSEKREEEAERLGGKADSRDAPAAKRGVE